MTSHKGHDVSLCSEFASKEDSAKALEVLMSASNFPKDHIERLEQGHVEVISLMEQSKFILSREFQAFQSLIDYVHNPKLPQMKSQLAEQVRMGQELNSKFNEAYVAFSASKELITKELSLLNANLEKIFTSMSIGQGPTTYTTNNQDAIATLGESISLHVSDPVLPRLPTSAQDNHFLYSQEETRTSRTRRPQRRTGRT